MICIAGSHVRGVNWMIVGGQRDVKTFSLLARPRTAKLMAEFLNFQLSELLALVQKPPADADESIHLPLRILTNLA